jgi:hypothetical protein
MFASSMGGHHQNEQLNYYLRRGSATTKASFDFNCHWNLVVAEQIFYS